MPHRPRDLLLPDTAIERGINGDTLERVFAVIEDRKTHPKSGSYTHRLLEAGQDEIVKKVGEEAIEVILAASHQGDECLISELADLAYHCLVLLASRGLTPAHVARELERRYQP